MPRDSFNRFVTFARNVLRLPNREQEQLEEQVGAFELYEQAVQDVSIQEQRNIARFFQSEYRRAQQAAIPADSRAQRMNVARVFREEYARSRQPIQRRNNAASPASSGVVSPGRRSVIPPSPNAQKSVPVGPSPKDNPISPEQRDRFNYDDEFVIPFNLSDVSDADDDDGDIAGPVAQARVGARPKRLPRRRNKKHINTGYKLDKNVLWKHATSGRLFIKRRVANDMQIKYVS
jgi:hypothetical protein